jgi:hypothetical protein
LSLKKGYCLSQRALSRKGLCFSEVAAVTVV